MSLPDILKDKNRYDLQFNQTGGKDNGIIFYGYPKFTYSKEKYETTAVNGKIGDFVTMYGGRGNARIDCTFAIIDDDIHKKVRDLKMWLSGSGKLKFSDSPESFYEVVLVDNTNFERKSRRFGLYEVGFVVYPYEFFEHGQIEYDVSCLSSNNYSECMPTYIITGNGECTLTVNGNEFYVNVPGYICIDSRRMLSFKEDMTPANTLVSGDYEDLFLPNGDVSISVSDGYGLKVIPYWGCLL